MCLTSRSDSLHEGTTFFQFTLCFTDDEDATDSREVTTVAQLKGTFQLGLNYTEDLEDPTSAEYQRQEKEFCGSVSRK